MRTARAPRQSRILGPNGKPVSYGTLYPSPRSNPKAYKPRYWLGGSLKDNLTEWDRQELVTYSRQLFAQVDALATAVCQKNAWAFGDAWDAHFLGTNRKWGERAAEFLNLQFFPFFNLRGPQFDMRRSMRISGQAWDVDGDDLMIFSQSEKGFPQVAFFPSTRIGSGYSRSKEGNVVSGGPFDGAKICDGVISDRNGRPIGYRILNHEDGTQKDVSAFNADLAFEADWHDQNRGIPRIATSLLKWMDLQDIDEFLRAGMKRASEVHLMVYNEEGEAPVGNEVVTGADHSDPDTDGVDGRKVYHEELHEGGTYYFTAGSDEKIETLDLKNPHPNAEAFIERVQRHSLASVGWFHELLHLNDGGRAPSRLLCKLANESIWSRQQTQVRRWLRIVRYAVAVAMKNGFLPRNDDGMDAYLWEAGLPARLTVDEGNDAREAREAIKMGITTKTIEMAKAGYHRRQIDAQRLEELRDTMRSAKALASEFGIPFDRAMELLEQRSPNPPVQQPQQQNQSSDDTE